MFGGIGKWQISPEWDVGGGQGFRAKGKLSKGVEVWDSVFSESQKGTGFRSG